MTRTDFYRFITVLHNLTLTYQPSLSAALTFTPNCTRNLTISVWPAHTALWRAVIPSSLGWLGSSTCGGEGRKYITAPVRDARFHVTAGASELRAGFTAAFTNTINLIHQSERAGQAGVITTVMRSAGQGRYSAAVSRRNVMWGRGRRISNYNTK